MRNILITSAGRRVELVDAKKANELTLGYEWALLPIDDEVTKYAFPSKTSSYASCGVKILSICSNHTSVAKWVLNNNYGVNSLPNINDIVNVLTTDNKPADRDYFSIEHFV